MPTWDSIARKVLVTVITGVISFFLANSLLSQHDIAFQLGASIFLGGVALVVMHLIEVDKRLKAVEDGQTSHAHSTEQRLNDGFESVERTLDKGFHDFSDATRVFAKLDASPMPTEMVMELVDDASSVDPTNELVLNFTQLEVQRLKRLLHELRHDSDSVYEGEDRDWMLHLTKSATKSIDAVSLTTVDFGVDGGLWNTDLGQRYLEQQRNAIQSRKVTTRRVFIAENQARLNSREFKEACDVHKRLGVEVRILDVHDAPGTLANTMFDFIVFDGVLSYESIPASQTTDQHKPIIIITTRLVREPSRVEERVKRFADLWEVARPLGDDDWDGPLQQNT